MKNINPNEILDFDTLKEFTDNNEALISSTLDLLITVIPEDINEIVEHLKGEKWDDIKSVLHRSKPNFMLVTKNKITQIILELEDLSLNSKNLSEFQEKFDYLKKCMPIIIEGIKEELKTIS